ncbi:hypothetical protein SPRG_12691 [Saprolegnia parasitica CBS 223.65]|uniref:Solanesyl diphosphate synthase n=1 Tax=Saprolegnia parasitica (strain CBS 223.65) TaxID=695850 RepID=A0A067BZE8_SAPPC|nr:hypothetical protein SPRG_12691 [Saprolegnia parasitica CBS 223.65]KDO22195.1 hypothetical protein SPRG_12691 [Saprolegnia parasitica CBS 223.65]|eukprot:XP_012207131.1 hypothetical protein SPRG_12691 [Saprolegnia parasitica CBS 223.65]
MPQEFTRLQNGQSVADCVHIHTPIDANPFKLLDDDMASVVTSIRALVTSDHPGLDAAASGGGKKVCPTMLLLMAQAADAATESSTKSRAGIAASQQRLAEVTEIIHAMSLLHDDVLDNADTRQGVASATKVFGSKLSVLVGDFLLARALRRLGRLGNLEAFELMTTALENLVQGEVLQMRYADTSDAISPFNDYLRKNYYKTASLLANSARPRRALAGCVRLWFCLRPPRRTCLPPHGRRLGLRGRTHGQIEARRPQGGSRDSPRSPWPQEEFPVLAPLIARRFSHAGDIELAATLVKTSTGLEKSKHIAMVQAELAILAILQYPPSPARDALIKLAQLVVTRSS